MKCEICGSHKIQDLGVGEGKGKNIYCTNCKAHRYNGGWISEKTWKWIVETEEAWKAYFK